MHELKKNSIESFMLRQLPVQLSDSRILLKWIKSEHLAIQSQCGESRRVFVIVRFIDGEQKRYFRLDRFESEVCWHVIDVTQYEEF